MNPIATKEISNDSTTDLARQVMAKRIIIDAEKEFVDVEYQIVSIAPNGAVAAVLNEDKYSIVGEDFESLRSSEIGLTIKGMVESRLSKMNFV